MAFRDSSFTSANALSLNATKPALTQPGDILYTYFFTDGGLNSGMTMTPPSGWTLVPGSNQGANTGAPDGWTSWVYWKMAGASEPATYTWTIAGIPATDLSAYIVALSGRKASPAVVSHGTVNTTGNATPVTVSDSGITPLAGDDVIVFATGDITVGTDAWSFGTLSNYTRQQNTQNGFNVGVCYTRENVVNTATGTISVTLTRNSGTGTSGWGIFVLSVPVATVAPTSKPTFRLGMGTSNIKLVRRPGMPQFPPEAITMDKWYVPETPIRRIVSQVAAIAMSVAFVPVVQQQTTPAMDWLQPQSQPYIKTIQRNFGGESRFEVPRTILPSDWSPTYQDWLKQKIRETNTGEFRFEVPRAILLSDYSPVYPDWLKQRFRDVNTGEYRFELPRTILLTDWSPTYHNQHWTKRRDSNTGESRFELPRQILITDWLSQFPDTLVKAKVIIQGEIVSKISVEPQATVFLDWYTEISQPVLRPRQNEYGESNFRDTFVPEPPPVPPSDWIVEIVQPLFRKLQFDTGISEISFAEILPPSPTPETEVRDGVDRPKYNDERQEKISQQLAQEDDEIFHFIQIFLDKCL